MGQKFFIGSEPININKFSQIVYDKGPVDLNEDTIKRIQKCHDYLMAQIGKPEAIYGLNTGFGPLSDVRIEDQDIEKLQYNYLRSHAAGIGEYLPEVDVRAMLLLRAQSLAQGHSGISVEIVQRLIDFINHEIYPRVPCQGSVGASGDLAPLAHLALALIGEGEVRYQNKTMPAKKALDACGIKPVKLHGKSGLALNNGTQFMTALGMSALRDAIHLANVADLCGAISLEVIRGTRAAFDRELQQVRPHPGQIEVAKNLEFWLTKSNGKISEISESHKDCEKVQDAYSFRCIPQIHGASRDWIYQALQVMTTEINSVTDNPIIFPKQDKIVSGGNFHGQYIAFALDQVAIALSEFANVSERRINKLTQPSFSGLPAFLTENPGLNSGVMILQYTAASIVSENKTLAHPASVDSIPTSLDKEDHVSMGAWGARKLGQIVKNLKRVLSIELFCACQGIDLLRPLKTTDRIEKIHIFIRKSVQKLSDDRILSNDIQKIEKLIDQNEFRKLVVPK